MTNKIHTYQAVFLLDNEEVRKGFNQAKDWVQTCLEKHNVDVKVLRLWGERALAYPIGSRQRATYLLGWVEASGEAVNEAKREMYLVGPAFRIMFLRADEIPAEEMEFGIETIEDSAVEIPDEIEEFEMIEEDVVEEATESKTEENTDERAGKKAADSSDESEAVAAGEENKEN
ncbi:MAG: 30S ribosomal protein S6 [Planctomycetota bacterium]|nr:30S ribosomal protein S6 [Planctomycetota bacterium]